MDDVPNYFKTKGVIDVDSVIIEFNDPQMSI